MRRFVFASAVVLGVLAAATTGRAIILLMTAGGMDFDIVDTSSFSAAYISDGEANAYDGAYYLDVNGARVGNPTRVVTRTLSNRQVEFAEAPAGGMMVRRLVYVPTTGGEYARFTDIIRNPGASDATITVRIHGNLGSNSTTRVTGSADGDTMAETTDNWFSTDDATDGAGSQSVAHVMQQTGGIEEVDMVALSGFSGDTFEWTFMNVMVPAGGSVVFLSFGIQGPNDAAVMAEATRVSALPSDTMMGLAPYLNDIVNFPIGGAPLVRIDADPTSADEGEAITFTATITDREMDPFTFSWDLDDDGTFGENVGMMTHTVMMGTTDGDTTVRVGVEASDGTESRSRYRSVAVRNINPTITSSPPGDLIFIGSMWTYDIVVFDPAGMADFPAYMLVDGPMGMDISMGGRVTWTPTTDQRDMTFPVHITVDDGDGGMDEQMFDVHVENNRPPEMPVPFSPTDRMRIVERMPTLVTTNAVDPDGDRLSYFYRIDRVSSLDSPFLVESPEVVEQMSGMTSWTVPALLEPGIYYWQVRANDGLADGPPANAIFVVGDPTVDAGAGDAGPGGPGGDSGPGIPPPPMPRDSGGCSASGPAPGSPFFALFAIGLVALVARRRRSFE